MENVQLFSVVGVWALVAGLIFHRLGFFRHGPSPWTTSRPNLIQAAIAFFLLVFAALILGPSLVRVVFKTSPYLTVLTSLLSVCFGITALLTYGLGKGQGTLFFGNGAPSWRRATGTFALGGLTWFLAFPVAVVLSQGSLLILEAFFGEVPLKQVAVRQLEQASESTGTLVLTAVTFVVLGPFLEELYFRGYLQGALVRALGSWMGILMSSLAFSAVHYSASQGLGNIPILIFLFVLSLFMGFIYEKKKSLFAPVGLHVVFNAVSVVRVLFSGE